MSKWYFVSVERGNIADKFQPRNIKVFSLTHSLTHSHDKHSVQVAYFGRLKPGEMALCNTSQFRDCQVCEGIKYVCIKA